LVIGCNGSLGWELCRRSAELNQAIIGLDLPDFDITNPTQVGKIIKNSALDCSLISKHFGIDPKPWLKSLENILKRLRATDD
jgi:dTDP-4-dehydrorhamnose reductase